MEEVWRDVVGFEGMYAVSDLGRIRSERKKKNTFIGKILSPCVDRPMGYLRLPLCDDGKQASQSVHRLVAAAFLGPCPLGQQVNHKNGDKLNNHARNLEYVTPRANTQHAIIDLGKLRRGEKSGQAKFSNAQADWIRRIHRRGDFSSRYLAECFGVCKKTIQKLIGRRTYA